MNPPHGGRWLTVWSKGHVDICFQHNAYRSEDSKKRFRKAFLCEKGDCSERIPNWAWGLAAYGSMLPHESVPLHVPPDHDWPRLKEAWRDGIRDAVGTRFAVRQVLLSLGIRNTGSASSSAAAPSARRNPNNIRS